ncbi:MAG TPA: phosphoglycolate phosphatase [Rhodospirillaceae bacterium]|nr:phosphoglycolate phosphatase [Rhodospirillaceae bacterium]
MNRAVIFDLDGTLIDSLPDVMNALNAVLADNGRRPVTLDEAKTMVGGGEEPLLERAFDATGESLPATRLLKCVDAFTGYYRENPATETTIFDGAIAALEALTGDGIKLGICTNKPHASALQVLEALGLAQHFDACFGKSSVPYHKPDRRHYNEVAKALGVDPDQSLYVGDSETDVETARNAGVPIIMVPFGYTHRPTEELGGDRMIAHFSELPDTVRELFAALSAGC